MLEGKEIKQVDKFKYLGSIVSRMEDVKTK